MNLYDAHTTKLKEFDKKYERIAEFELQLAEKNKRLRELKHIITQNRLKVYENHDLLKKRKKTESEQKQYQLLQDSADESNKYCSEIKELEEQIYYLENNISDLKQKNEEIEYIINTKDIFDDYAVIQQLDDNGFYELVQQKNIVYPEHLRVHYTEAIHKPIELKFVNESNRNIFANHYKLNPTDTYENVLNMYTLILNNLCGKQTIEKAIIYLTPYRLLLPPKKSLDEIIRYYGIPTTKPLEIYVCTKNIPTDNNKKRSRKHLFEEYKDITTTTVTKKVKTVLEQSCPECKYDGEMRDDEKNGELICPHCGFILEARMVAKGFNGVPYDDIKGMAYIKKSDYKPIMHLNDILKQRQGIESTEVPLIVIEKLNDKLIKHHITDRKNQLTIDIIKLFLKELKATDPKNEINYPGYYEHAYQILLKLGGPPPICYLPEDEAKIKMWFKKLLEPFAIFKPPLRKNLFAYNYLLRQICLLISCHETNDDERDFWIDHALTWTLLKDPGKQKEYDIVFEKMMNLLKEPFIASV